MAKEQLVAKVVVSEKPDDDILVKSRADVFEFEGKEINYSMKKLIEYEGEEMSLSFNPQFLSDPFKHIGVDNVNIKINDAFSPIAIESTDGFLYVIMPMRNK